MEDNTFFRDLIIYFFSDELDSYMFQTVGHHAIDLYADALGLPLYTQVIQGSSLATGKDYAPLAGDEVEDLYILLSRIKVWYIYWQRNSTSYYL